MAFWAREKLLPHIGVRRVESSQESARDPGLSVAGAAGEQAAATTKSLNWTAPTASQQWAKHCGTLGLSEAAASQGVRSVEPSQESARDPPECCLSVAGAAGEQAAATTKSLHWTATTSSKCARNCGYRTATVGVVWVEEVGCGAHERGYVMGGVGDRQNANCCVGGPEQDAKLLRDQGSA